MSNTTKKRGQKTPSLTELIFTDIRIGTFGPGVWLKQIDLEERYGAKRIAVRKALDELVAKRMVEHIPNRGYRVYELDATRRRELRAIRTLLETFAVDEIIGNVGDRDVEELYGLAEAFQRASYDGTVLELNDANAAFHQRLLKLCDNATLVELIMEMRNRGPAAPVTRWRTVAQLEKVSNDHFLIVEGLRRRDAGYLKRVIAGHINEAGPEVFRSVGDGGR
jgi:DNA-binding GntR family transcriptional regulator